MKIKHVKVYPSVKFEGKEQTYFNAKEYRNEMQVVSIPSVEIEKTPSGILIYNNKDCIEIYQTNIAFVQYDGSPEKKKVETKKA